MKRQSDGIKIVHTTVLDEARRLAREGWEPIQCFLGGESVVGRLRMDDHGTLSHLEGVAIRAYRDYFGACRENCQGFVVTGAADAGATFAIAALAGMLPHPSREEEFKDAPTPTRDAMTADLLPLAERIHCDPIKRNALVRMYDDQVLLAWRRLSSRIEDRTAFHAGVDRWRLLTGPLAPLWILDAAEEEEAR